jgi:hypothetical protein
LIPPFDSNNSARKRWTRFSRSSRNNRRSNRFSVGLQFIRTWTLSCVHVIVATS